MLLTLVRKAFQKNELTEISVTQYRSYIGVIKGALEHEVLVVEDEADRLSAVEPFVHVPSGSPFGKGQVSKFRNGMIKLPT